MGKKKKPPMTKMMMLARRVMPTKEVVNVPWR